MDDAGFAYTAETFTTFNADAGETGWSVKYGDDTLCDCTSEGAAKQIAAALNAMGVKPQW